MEIVWEAGQLERYMVHASEVNPGAPILIDRYLEEATEVDVDCIADDEQTVVAGIMEHIEEAGIHSGDSSCTLPTHSLNEHVLMEIRRTTKILAKELEVRGLLNIQYAIQGEKVYILEANPRASRTVPFVSKAIGVPLAKLAAKVMIGKRLAELGFEHEPRVSHIAVKKSVFPFNRFPGTDIILGPEMKSTGEVMGIDDDFGTAFAKSHMAASQDLPLAGKVFLSVVDRDKKYIPSIAHDLQALGFGLMATPGTKKQLDAAGIEGVEEVRKIQDSVKPNILDLMVEGEVKLVINTPSGRGRHLDESKIRQLTITLNIPCITTISAARAAVNGIRALKAKDFRVRALQDYFPK
jgi:carbamoyl-phosphate synthase large subunit